MNDRRSSADLGSSAEAALRAFSFPERDWESDARAVEARLGESLRGSTADALLAAPLPSEPGEEGAASATATPLANSGVRTQSLADLARRSVEKKQAGEREMARASLAIAAQQRPSSEEVRALREAMGSAPGAAPPAPPSVTSSVVVSAVVTSPRPTLAAASASNGAPSPWPKIAVGIPVLALAAAALLWLRQPSAPAPLVTNALPPATTEVKPVAAAKAGSSPEGAANTAAVSMGVDPSTLPGEAAPKPTEATPRKVATGAAAPAAGSAKAGSEKIVLDDEQPAAVAAAPTPTPTPTEKPVEKALPPDPALRPADSSGGELPVKPSTGAVQAALGSVMSGARHCVAGDDAPSSAVVVFGSDGHVQNVSVSGPAAGKSSAACIQAQLGRARVQPFAAASFSVNATVRPD